MSIFGSLLGTDQADAARRAAADTYGKQTAATGQLRDYGDQYADRFSVLARGFDPYTRAGGEAANQFTNLLRDPSNVRNLPGYQFDQEQGARALDHSAVSRSGIMNGRLVKDQTRFATNLADKTYGDQFARLMAANGQGVAATGAQAGVEGTGLQGQLATRQSAYGGDMKAAETIGQGDIAAENARTSALQNLLNTGAGLAGMAMGGGGMTSFGGLTSLLGGGGGQRNPHWYGQRAGVDF